MRRRIYISAAAMLGGSLMGFAGAGGNRLLMTWPALLLVAWFCWLWWWNMSFTARAWRRHWKQQREARRIGVCWRCFRTGPTHSSMVACQWAEGLPEVEWDSERQRFVQAAVPREGAVGGGQ